LSGRRQNASRCRSARPSHEGKASTITLLLSFIIACIFRVHNNYSLLDRRLLAVKVIVISTTVGSPPPHSIALSASPRDNPDFTRIFKHQDLRLSSISLIPNLWSNQQTPAIRISRSFTSCTIVRQGAKVLLFHPQIFASIKR
jgi:hypothetical protein